MGVYGSDLPARETPPRRVRAAGSLQLWATAGPALTFWPRLHAFWAADGQAWQKHKVPPFLPPGTPSRGLIPRGSPSAWRRLSRSCTEGRGLGLPHAPCVHGSRLSHLLGPTVPGPSRGLHPSTALPPRSIPATASLGPHMDASQHVRLQSGSRAHG